MRSILLYTIVFIFFLPETTVGQITTNDAPQVLEKLYGRLINKFDDNDRIRINDSIKSIIDNYVLSDTIFSHRFNNLRYMGQITSPDSLLKIITWNLVLRNSPSLYFCYFIRKTGKGSKNIIYRLTTEYKEEPVKTDTIYTEKNWYGALYYDLKPVISDNKKWWVLLGIDYGNTFISRKIVDVLSFTPGDSIIFGNKWFVAGDEIRFRDVFEYASNGMMSLRFSSGKSVVFDHLVPFNPAMKGDRQYYGPDYSYDAYYFENGLWKLTINVDARNKE
ncbi:MAG: hypothetical protein Q7J06_10485 [Bacteroidales bacterium]|nr:hypothetical protein [Bacteroidales bacterium]